MALPPELATANVYGTYVNLDGGPTVGYLIFQPSPVILKATASREFIVPTTMQVNLDETGHFTIVLPACDDPDVTPSDWTYQVTEAFGSRRVYSIEVHVANGTDQNIYDLAPVALANGTYYLQGDRGPAGPDVLTTVGKPAADVGDDGDKAFDLAAGVVYVRTGTTWDNGTAMGTSSPTGGSLVRRDANGRVQAADPAANSDGATKGYVDTQDTATLASAKSYADSQDTAAKVGPTFTGPVQVTGNQTVTGSQVVSANQTVGGTLSVSGQTSLGAATVSGTPTNAADVVRKDYVDNTVGTDQSTASKLVRRDSGGGAQFSAVGLATQVNAWDATRKDYVDAADAQRVQLGGDLGGTVTAPQVTSGTHHTHTSAQVSDAASAATASVVAKRDAAGRLQVVDPAAAADAATKNYVDTADALRVQLGGDLGGTVTAPTVTVGTHHTHTSSQVTDATNAATASMLVKRDAAGAANLSSLLLPGSGAAPTLVATTGTLYTSTTDGGLYYAYGTGGQFRRVAHNWGNLTTFPGSPSTGDTCTLTVGGANTTWSYTGSRWVLEEDPVLATVAARNTWLAALPVGAAYNGMRVYVTAQNQAHIYDATNSKWHGTLMISYGVAYNGSGNMANLNGGSVTINSTSFQDVWSATVPDPGWDWQCDGVWRNEAHMTNGIGRLQIRVWNQTDAGQLAFLYLENWQTNNSVWNMPVLPFNNNDGQGNAAYTGAKLLKGQSCVTISGNTAAFTNFAFMCSIHVVPAQQSAGLSL